MKLKSHSGTKKRVKVTGNKRIFMQKNSKNHLLTHKSKRQKDLYDKGKPVHASDLHRILKLLPYVKN